MHCPFCKHPGSRVIDSRSIDGGTGIRRRRECGKCNTRFTTYEHFTGLPLTVLKKDNHREPFDCGKIKNGIARACNKRGIKPELIDRIVDETEAEIRKRAVSEVKVDLIGEIIMGKLRDLDEIAYLRYASVFKKFDDPSEFIQEAKSLGSLKNQQKNP